MEDIAQEENAVNNESARPAAKFTGSGGLSVAIWKNKSENGYDNYSVRLERNYKLEDGTYKSTQYLRDADLLRAERLLTQADDWIEQDKGRQRSPASSQAR